MFDTHAVVWVDTNGKFYSQSCADQAAALKWIEGLNMTGLPAVIITRQEVIDGDFKSNAQMEDEADDK